MEQSRPLATRPAPQLAERARAFQHDALAELFERTFDDAYGYAQALTGDHATAEEVVETAYRRVIDRLPGFQDESTVLAPWVLAMVQEAVHRLPRSRFAGHALRESIARLVPPEHQALTLRLVAGLDAAAIAAATGRREVSVLSSGLVALRTLHRGKPTFGLTMPAAQRQADAAFDRLLAGEPPAEAAAATAALADAGALLRTAGEVVGLPREAASPAVRARIRNHFLATAEERRARWVHRHHAPADVPGRRPTPRPRPVGTAAALALAAVLAVVAGVVLAAAAGFSTPSSPIYPLKRFDEALLLAVTGDRLARANLEVKLAAERMKEAETEASFRHGDLAAAATAERFDILRRAGADLAAAPRRDAAWRQARGRYEQEASRPVDQLERLMNSNGLSEAARQVRRDNERFQADRARIDRELGAAPTGSPTEPTAIPTP